MKIKNILLLLSILSLLSFAVHKHYLSLTQIEYRSKLKSLQITINVSIDAIEFALNKDYNIDLQLTTEKELNNNAFYFKKYLNENLHLKINSIPKKFDYIGKKYEGDLLYFYLEIQNIETPNSIEIENKILITHFPKQKNIVKYKAGEKHKTILLTSENHKGLLKF